MTTLVKSVSVMIAVGLFAFGFSQMPNNKSNPSDILLGQDSGITMSEEVKAIIDTKCMGCHKPDSRNEKAKKKLQWAKVSDMNKEEQEHLVDEMFEVLEDGKMPPKRAVERRPQMKLTDEETKTLLSWMEAEEKRLKGE